MRETGFAVLVNTSISAELLEKTYSDWAKFFSSPEKNDYTFSTESQFGFFPMKSENAKNSAVKDLKEFYHLYNQRQLPSNLSSATLELREQMLGIGAQLLDWLEAESSIDKRVNFSEPLRNMIRGSEQSLTRILHYPPLPGQFEDGAVRAAAHEDINLITLLPAATESGLEVLDSNGNWQAVTCEANSLVVNIGDMLERASNGFFRSTTHRVVNPSGDAAKRSRYSMPLFIHPRPEVILSRDSEPFTAREFLDQRLRELGLK